MKETVLYYVIPCYNEEEVLPETSSRLLKKVRQLVLDGRILASSRILFVDDGSKDRTWQMIRELHEENEIFSGLRLTRNRGHQNALLAGLLYAKEHADVTISMDADLQDDIEATDEMLKLYEDGCDIVYGVRSDRNTDSAFKRNTARMFYSLMSRLGVEMVSDSADFRLMSRRALEGLAQFKEVNLFLRGLVPMIGYTSGKVYYKRGERFAGESKYPLRKMLNFSVEGITSLSIAPIRVITNIGIFVFLISILMLLWGIVQKLRGLTVQGWSSMMVSIWAVGGLILLSQGIVGEYVGKIYMEAKGRPRFLIAETLDCPPKRDCREARDMDALEAIMTRRSTRKYKADEVGESELGKVIEAGRMAPSGGNSQKCHFLVVTDRDVLMKLETLTEQAFAKMDETEGMYGSLRNSIRLSKKGGYHFFYRAPVLIITANDPSYGNNLADCAAAVENMMIAANALGLGSCYINQLRWLNEEPSLVSYLQELGMKEGERVYASVAVGWPDTADSLPPRTPLKRTGNEVTRI